MNEDLHIRPMFWEQETVQCNLEYRTWCTWNLTSLLHSSMNRLPSNTIFTVVVVFLLMHYMFRSTRPSSDAAVHLTCFTSVMFSRLPHWPVFTFFGGVVDLRNSCQIRNKINKNSLVYTNAETYIVLWLKYFFPAIGSWFMVYVFVSYLLM
jgi:hypothetical protein